MEISAECRRRLRDLYFSGSTLGGSPFGGLDQLPELRILLQRLVFRNLQTGAEEEVFEGMAVENAMDDQAQLVAFEIDPVISHSEPVQDSARPLEFAELVQLGIQDLLRQTAKLAEDLELELFGHPRQFRGAGRVEDNLKQAHSKRIQRLTLRLDRRLLLHRIREVDCPSPNIQLLNIEHNKQSNW